MTLLLESLLLGSVVLAATLLSMRWLRSASAAFRHCLVAAALLCVVLAPLVVTIAPTGWRMHRAPGSVNLFVPVTTEAIVELGTIETRASAGTMSESQPLLAPSLQTVAITTWITGSVVSLAVLALALWRLVRAGSRAVPLTNGVWVDAARQLSNEHRMRPPALLETTEDIAFVTWGAWRPKVTIPASARTWQAQRVHVVLRHELAHIRRHDCMVQLLADLARCVYWFNPLIWLACARLRQESEQACDDVVIGAGVSGAEYATLLTDIARSVVVRRQWSIVPAMARASSLEWRVRMMLNATVNRRPIGRLAGLGTVIALVAVTMLVGGAVAGAQTPLAPFSGRVFDSSSAPLAAAEVKLTNPATGATYAVPTDGSGRFEFVALPAGEYQLSVALPGFATLRGTLTMSGQAVEQDVILQVGSLVETITVVGGAARPEPLNRPATGAAPPGTFEPPVCSPSAAPTVRVGGNIRPPKKLVDVRPVFPPTQSGAGHATLRAQIATDGQVGDVELVNATHPDYANVAIDAVRQWKFTPTYLNCAPVAVWMDVNVRFDYQP